MRRKNRQIKMTIDIPDSYDNDEKFMEDLRDTLDENGWRMVIEDEDGELDVPLNRITLGDIEIEPEEEE